MSKKKHKWISVKERLPQISDFYLVCISPDNFQENLGRAIVFYNKYDQKWYSQGFSVSNVRYWRNLPKLPKVTSGGGYIEKDI